MKRNLAIEDAVSPMIERAKIAIGTFGQRADAHFSRPEHRCTEPYCETCARQQDAWSAILAEGHPTQEEIRSAFRGQGLGRVTHNEVRAVIILAILRNSMEMADADYEDLPPMQQLARTVANWIMEAFDAAAWMTEEEALMAITQPHHVAG